MVRPGVLLVCAALLLPGCAAAPPMTTQGSPSATPSYTGERPTPPPPAPPPSHAPLTGVAAECGVPEAPGRLTWVTTSDRVRLRAIEAGSGPRGVVLVHQLGSSACGWWPYAARLAAEGYRVVAPTLRCFGDSECPSAVAVSRRTDLDVAAAVSRLRAQGARSVVVVGASLGAAVAVSTSARPPAGVRAVVALSPPMRLPVARPGTGRTGMPGDVVPAVPLLLVTSDADRDAPPGYVRAFADRVGSRASLMVVAGGGHGWNLLLAGVAGQEDWTPTAAAVERFLARQLRA